MASGKRGETTASSYLQQYISRTTGPHQGCANSQPNLDDNYASAGPCIGSYSHFHGKSDDYHEVRKAVESSDGDPRVLPAPPRSTPLKHTLTVPQPPSSPPMDALRRTLEIAQVVDRGTCETTLRQSDIVSVGVGVGAGDRRPRIKPDTYVKSQQRDSRTVGTATSFQAPSGGDRPRLSSYSAFHRERLIKGSMELERRTRWQAEDIRPLSAEESRALFWEELESLDAMSTKVNSDCKQYPPGGDGGCRSARRGETVDEGVVRVKGDEVPVNRDFNQSVPVPTDRCRGFGPRGQPAATSAGKGRLDDPSDREGEGVRGAPNQSKHLRLRTDSLFTAARAEGAPRRGKGSASQRSSTRRKASLDRGTLLCDDDHAAFFRGPYLGRAALPTLAAGCKSPCVVKTEELALGQALRTVGGLVAGDGAKLSAVGKHITSLDGVSPGLSSRATHLFVSNNSLRSLRGLQRFSGVTSLSLAHNLVRRTEDLRPLAFLARLETLSLEGNPVCGAPNYRAHVIALSSPCLKTLDRREVTPAEATEARAIVAAERSLVDRTFRQRCRCAVLDHMSRLLECHAELREDMLTPARHAKAAGGMGCRSRAWRQQPIMTTPMKQILTVARVEHWTSFDQSERELVERTILDEATELFAENIASRRAAGQRTHDLSERATAALDSPSTGVWLQLLGEVSMEADQVEDLKARAVQRRTQASEDDVIARCEAIRRRESELFRLASAKASAFFQGLARSVGHSDDQWAIPHRIERPPAVREARIGEAAARSDTNRDKKSTPSAASSHPKGLAWPGSNRPAAALAAQGNAQDKTSGEDIAKSRSQQGSLASRLATAKERGLPMDVGEGGIEAKLEPASNATKDRPEVSDEDASVMKVMEPPAPSKQPRRPAPRPQSVQPSTQGGSIARDTGAVRDETKAPQTTTMASVAKFLLARQEPLDFERGAAALSEHRGGATESSRVNREWTLEAGRTKGALKGMVDRSDTNESGPYGQRVQRTVDLTEKREGSQNDSWYESREVTSRFAPSTHPLPFTRQETRERCRPALPPPTGTSGNPTLAKLAERADQSVSAVVASTVVEARTLRFPDDTLAVFEPDTGSRYPTENRQIVTHGGNSGRIVDENEGLTRAEDGEHSHCGSSEVTRRLLLEASSIKRLLEAMDKADASAAGDDLEDEVPERFVGSVGLVEFKPLSQKLTADLDLAPERLLADPSLFVKEPRTTRALRDQVIALGKEVIRRAEACAEARKLNAALRRQIEGARRMRAKNLDAVDVACRRVITKGVEEAKVIQESRGVAQEAEFYHAALTRLQEQVEKITEDTREIVSSSEALAGLLRDEMEGRGGELSERRRAAEDGLTSWEQAAEADPALRARRRVYDCEILVLSHRMAGGSASLATAFYRLREQTGRQRRARAWFSEARGRRDARLVCAAFDALARGGRSKAAEAVVAVARCRAGLATWRRTTALARRVKTFRWARDRALAGAGFRRWRQRAGGINYGDEWAMEVVEEETLLARSLGLFRERRAKRIVLRAWHGAVQTAAVVEIMKETGARHSTGRSGRARRQSSGFGRQSGVISGRDELSPGGACGARLRNAEAIARRRRFETEGRFALRWWWQQSRSSALGKTAGQRRSIRQWRRWAENARSARRASTKARERYIVTLGRRVITAWSVTMATRARRRAGAAAFFASLSSVIRRKACRRWASHAALTAVEAEQTMAALEHCYNGCLRSHLRAWSALAKKRRLLCHCLELLGRGHRVVKIGTAFRAWRRGTAHVRDIVLRGHRIKAWSAAATRRRSLAALSLSFHVWSRLCRRAAVIHSLTIRAADRKRRLALARGFRAFCLSRRWGIIAIDRRRTVPGRSGCGAGGSGDNDEIHYQSEGDEAAQAVETVVQARAALEGRVDHLRARLAEERALALERRAEAGRVAEEIQRSERERVCYVKHLQQEEAANASADSGLPRDDTPEKDGEGLLVAPSLGARFGDLTKRQSEAFEKLQAETLEMRQRATLAEGAAQEARAETTRKAVAARAAIEETLAEGRKLKQELEQRKALRARVDLEAARAASQATALSDRFAGAEQELGFETTRNADIRCAKDKENSRLRAAATVGERRLVAAESALRRKDKEIEYLRSRAARQGFNNGGGKSAEALQFRIFAVEANARCAMERCSEAAVEKRAAAGSAMAEAFRAAGSETAVEADRRAIRFESSCDGEGKMAEAGRLVSESAANERREVAGLALRRAEAKLRRTADLSLRASLNHTPLREHPRSPVNVRGSTEATNSVAGRTAVFAGGKADPTFESQPEPNRGTAGDQYYERDTSEGCSVANTNTVVANGNSSYSSSSEPKGNRNGSPRWVEAMRDGEESVTEQDHPTLSAGQETPPAEGLQELREEIADLEGKILRRLGGGSRESDRILSFQERSGEVGDSDAMDLDLLKRAKSFTPAAEAPTEKGLSKASRSTKKASSKTPMIHRTNTALLAAAGTGFRRQEPHTSRSDTGATRSHSRRGGNKQAKDQNPARSSRTASQGHTAAARDKRYRP